jgi:hypothetical protein
VEPLVINIFLQHGSIMKTALVTTYLMMCIITLVHQGNAQTVCLPPNITVTESFSYPWQGGCCEAIVTACVSAPPNRIVSLVGVQLIGDCWGDLNPDEAPYRDVALLGFEKILLRRHQLIGIPSIPQCPAATTVTVETRVGSCGYYASYSIPVTNPDGSQGTRTVHEYISCGVTECVRTCTMCVMATLDPCNNNEYRLYYTCEGQVSPPQCPSTGCKYPMCSGVLP